jgi:molecular chaperone DnaJ
MTETHYQTLQITSQATADEIKQSYRRLAKEFHPDLNRASDNHDRIVKINAAYEVLSDPLRRREYDWQLQPEREIPRQQQDRSPTHRRPRTVGKEIDEDLILWLNQVYTPVNRMTTWIIKPLKSQINELSADPFDDDLMANFTAYLTDCERHLDKLDRLFHSIPNPAPVAAIAADLYYCIDRLTDGIKELNFYTMNYDDRYLHTGQEMFKIASEFQKEAKKKVKYFK